MPIMEDELACRKVNCHLTMLLWISGTLCVVNYPLSTSMLIPNHITK